MLLRLLILGALSVCGILSAEPRRIVSLAPLVTEQVILLGEAGRLVGTTAYCPRLPEGCSSQIVGNIVEVNQERILLLKPDLILASDINARSGLDRLTKLGLDVRQVPEGNDFGSVCGSFLSLARFLGREQRAQELVMSWKSEAESFRPTRTKGRRIFTIVGSQPLITAGQTSFISSVIAFAGASNSVRKKEPWIRYSAEEVLKDRPDLVLLILPAEAAAPEREFWAAKGFRTAVVDPDLFGLATPPSFLKSARIIRDILDGAPAR